MKLSQVTRARSLLIILVVLVVIYQLFWVERTFSRYAVQKVWVNRHLDAVSRSADAAYGSDFLAYISFLRQKLPQDAVVVDTRTFGLPQYDIYTFLQYFLFPRTIKALSNASCPGETNMQVCIQTMSGPHVYFIYGADLTLSSSVPEDLIIVPFNSSSGLLAPKP